MYKRLIAIPLCIIFCIAVFSSSVFADIPTNDYNGEYPFSVTVKFGNAPLTGLIGPFDVFVKNFGYGEFIAECQYYTLSNSTKSTEITSHLTFSIPQSKRIYVAVRNNAYNSGGISFPSLESYFNSDASLFEEFTNYQIPNIRYDVDHEDFSVTSTVLSSAPNNLGVRFLCFEDVPAGTYTVIDSSDYLETVSGTSLKQAVLWVVAGVFVNRVPVLSSIVDDYINGDVGFSDALGELSSSLNGAIEDSATPADKQFHASLGQFELDRLVQASNDKNMTQIQNTLVPSLNNSVNSFASGSSSLEDSLSSLNSSFGSSLDSAETPEQALLVSTQYQIALKKLELQAQFKAKNKLDSAISDDEMSQFDSYYQTEEDIIQLFDKEEFESKLDYQTWLLQLPTTEAIQYRQFFEYILNDSPWKYFILIPMMMTLVSIVLGTRIRLRGSDEAPKSDSFTSSYSGKWDYQNRG